MKSLFFLIIFCLLCSVLIVSCVSFPFQLNSKRSWAASDVTAGTVRISGVSVDKAGGWISIENEIREILPLLFLQHKLTAVRSDEPADFSAEVIVREREYNRWWNQERSLSVEVYLCSGESGGFVSAGAVTGRGQSTLASSKVLYAMLNRAVDEAVNAMVKL